MNNQVGQDSTGQWTPAQYAIDAGWDYTCIEATAARGVSEEDADGLTAEQQAALLDFCRGRVADKAEAAATEWVYEQDEMERGPEGVQMLKELVVLRREMEEEAAKREYTAAMVKQGISKIEIFPLDADRPFGIAANYYDADGECFWTQSFDRNDSAEWIRECVFNALKEGVQNRIEASRKKKKGTKYE
jgi:hypothetical protein